MLESILTHLHNWFLQETYAGTFTIAQGSITLPFLREGQFFRIVGSARNDPYLLAGLNFIKHLYKISSHSGGSTGNYRNLHFSVSFSIFSISSHSIF